MEEFAVASPTLSSRAKSEPARSGAEGDLVFTTVAPPSTKTKNPPSSGRVHSRLTTDGYFFSVAAAGPLSGAASFFSPASLFSFA